MNAYSQPARLGAAPGVPGCARRPCAAHHTSMSEFCRMIWHPALHTRPLLLAIVFVGADWVLYGLCGFAL
jgi:hypothetical protein